MAEPTPEDIKAGYGFVALLGNAVPEINAVLQQAIAGKWTPDRFVMSVANTGWWKNTPAATREWIIKSATDPMQAAAESLAGADSVRRMAEQLGITVPSIEQAKELWLHQRVFNLDEDGMQAHLARVLNPSADRGGEYGRLINDMFRLSSEYGYTSNDISGEILGAARAVMSSGKPDPTAWQSKMIDYAQRKFAPYAEDIRGGKTVAEIARPIVERVANLFEVNPEALDFNDPLLKKALTEWGEESRAYSLNEIENMARQDARWRKTDNAMESSVKLLTEIGQTFGVLGGGR